MANGEIQSPKSAIRLQRCAHSQGQLLLLYHHEHWGWKWKAKAPAAAVQEKAISMASLKPKHLMKHILVITAIVVLLGMTLFLIRESVLLAIGDFLVVQDELQPADVIHIISGPDDRTDYAIQLYQQGYGRQLFFTGGWCTFHNYYHGQHGRERALEQGVPPEAIAIDDSQVTSTYAEVFQLKEFIIHSQAPIHSVIVVSDPYHMRRARWTYRRLLGDQVSLQMAPVPFELSPYQRRWWTDEDSRQYVKNEYLKMAYYYVRYQFGVGPLRKWLASLDQD
jgi:uncharacterized SAM-binding protein YcdF (DUF218 family)